MKATNLYGVTESAVVNYFEYATLYVEAEGTTHDTPAFSVMSAALFFPRAVQAVSLALYMTLTSLNLTCSRRFLFRSRRRTLAGRVGLRTFTLRRQ